VFHNMGRVISARSGECLPLAAKAEERTVFEMPETQESAGAAPNKRNKLQIPPTARTESLHLNVKETLTARM
jgi:hypothetical protein